MKTVRGDALTTADRVGAPVLALFYEDVLMQRPGNRWRDILDFLAFAPRQPTAHQARELLQISPTTLVACERLVEQYDVHAASLAVGLSASSLPPCPRPRSAVAGGVAR